jgi:hypothetical protein
MIKVWLLGKSKLDLSPYLKMHMPNTVPLNASAQNSMD